MAEIDIENMLRLLEERDADAIGSGDPTFWGAGRGVLTTGEVRRALLGERVYEGLAS